MVDQGDRHEQDGQDGLVRSNRDFLTLWEAGADVLGWLVDRAIALKANRGGSSALAGKSVALVFEKPSTRTRVSFDVAVHELGGHPVIIDGGGSQIGRGESIADTARVLARYVAGIVYRTAGHDRAVEMAAFSEQPVVNALTDHTHPCQVVADLLTVREEFGHLKGVKCAWIGDGNNMTHSWIYGAALSGCELVIATPQGYEPDPEVVRVASALGNITLVQDPMEAACGAQVVSTDTWASMGQEDDKAKRERDFAGFEVNRAVVAAAAKGAIVLHCLPAYRGLEISAEVLDGSAARVWRQAENRLHVQKAILEWAIAGAGPDPKKMALGEPGRANR